jgi:1,4-alpha-glucan branching enzyme
VAFVSFLQNHDQIGNRAFGERIAALAEPAAVRAAMTILLLAPSPPLLFMGEDWGSTQPFPFFCDFGAELADKVREGRRREFARFPEFRDEAARARIPDPNADSTFASAVVDWSVPAGDAGRVWLDFTKELLDLRQREIVPRLAGMSPGAGFRLVSDRALVATWHCADGTELRLSANLSPEPLDHAPAPPLGRLIVASGVDAAAGFASGRWPPWSVTWLATETPTPSA